MASDNSFSTHFDAMGRFAETNGELPVVFSTRGGITFPGRLRFKDGVCYHAEIDGGGDWGQPDDSPLDGIKFLLKLDDGKLHGITLDQGLVFLFDEETDRASKRQFLANLRAACKFLGSKVESDSPKVDDKAVERSLNRAAFWLTPKSVAGFEVKDFSEIGPVKQRELKDRVERFLAIAREVPLDKPATDQQFSDGRIAFLKIIEMLAPYLPQREEEEVGSIEATLRKVRFPVWVIDWNCELGSDEDDKPIVWIDLYVDDGLVPTTRLGREVLQLTQLVRRSLEDAGIQRWPFLRLKKAKEPMTV